MARALFLQIAGALVATLCQDQALKLVRIHNKVLHLLWLCVSLECPCFTYKYAGCSWVHICGDGKVC